MNTTTSASQHVLPSHERVVATVRDWLTDYISQPSNLIGRTGPVCPFVSPSRRAGSLEILVRPVGADPGLARVSDLLRAGLEEFHQIRWKGSNPALRSLVIVLPDLDENGCQVLDDAHRAIKPIAVARGMMIGQFHPTCTEPAARNAEFPVSRAPVPLVAIRAMALHDVLFLHGREDWFTEYHRRFAGHHEPGRKAIEPLFAELFRNACAEYGMVP
jgi:heptaprenyl diphosphate synthase